MPHIVILSDGETYSDVEGSEVWEITQEQAEKLGIGEISDIRELGELVPELYKIPIKPRVEYLWE